MEYTVLIADDEYWTREKLCRMIQWEDYSLRLLTPASNGEEVLERLEKEHVDILITDIKMPFVSGVELLQILREKYPEIVSFVVSGYDDFCYVRDSFMAGSVHYLVKPVTKIALVNALVKALESISRREKERSQLLRAASLIQDREYSRLVQQSGVAQAASQPLNDGTDLSMVGMLLIKIHNMHTLLEQGQDLNRFSYEMKKEIKAAGGNENLIVFNYIYRTNEFLVISELPEKEVLALTGKIADYFAAFQGVYLTFCVGRRCYSTEGFPAAYVEDVGLLMTRAFRRENQTVIARGETKNRSASTIRTRLRNDQEKQLKRYLESGRYEALSYLALEESGLSACEENGWSYMDVRQAVHQILNVISEFVQENCGQETAVAVDGIVESADKAVESLDAENVCALIQEVIDCLEPVSGKKESASMKEIVRQAAAYIDDNYFEELTPGLLAEKYHVENSYFSRVFREETGKTPSVYITEKRMEKAKEYIRNKNISLTEAAFLVGYDDYTYFSRVFRKNTGASPREYRGQRL